MLLIDNKYVLLLMFGEKIKLWFLKWYLLFIVYLVLIILIYIDVIFFVWVIVCY